MFKHLNCEYDNDNAYTYLLIFSFDYFQCRLFAPNQNGSNIARISEFCCIDSKFSFGKLLHWSKQATPCRNIRNLAGFFFLEVVGGRGVRH